MAHPSVIAAVETRLAAGFSACPIYSENATSSTPGDGSPFLVVQFPFARTTWSAIEGPDGAEFTEEGAVRFILFVERGGGARQGRLWLDEIAALFRGAAFADIQFFAPDSPVADDRNEDGVVRFTEKSGKVIEIEPGKAEPVDIDRDNPFVLARERANLVQIGGTEAQAKKAARERTPVAPAETITE